MSYRIAYSTNAYTEWTLDKAIEDVRARGFDGVEILADTPHAFPPAEASSIRTALRGFPVSNLNGNTWHEAFEPSLCDAREGDRRIRVDYVRGVIDLARDIGADTVCTSSGFCPEGLSPPQAEELFADSLRLVLDHAEKEPRVRIGIEYEPGFLVSDRRSLERVFGKVRHSLLGVNLDIGHAVCVGDRIDDVLDAFAGKIWNLHVEDIEGTVHHHLIPGHGSISFEDLRRSLDRSGYDGFLTLEIYPYKDRPGEAGTESLEFLRKQFS